MSSSFLKKIIYKKERVGVVEKDGKTYVKYVKARRFRINKNLRDAVISGFILLVLGMGIRLLMSELNSRQPPDEAGIGIGQ